MSLQNIIDFFRDITFVQGFIASLLATIVVGIALFLWRRLRDWRKSFVGLNTEPGTNQSATSLFKEDFFNNFIKATIKHLPYVGSYLFDVIYGIDGVKARKKERTDLENKKLPEKEHTAFLQPSLKDISGIIKKLEDIKEAKIFYGKREGTFHWSDDTSRENLWKKIVQPHIDDIDIIFAPLWSYITLNGSGRWTKDGIYDALCSRRDIGIMDRLIHEFRIIKQKTELAAPKTSEESNNNVGRLKNTGKTNTLDLQDKKPTEIKQKTLAKQLSDISRQIQEILFDFNNRGKGTIGFSIDPVEYMDKRLKTLLRDIESAKRTAGSLSHILSKKAVTTIVKLYHDVDKIKDAATKVFFEGGSFGPGETEAMIFTSKGFELLKKDYCNVLDELSVELETEHILNMNSIKKEKSASEKPAETEQEIKTANDNLRNDKKSTIVWDVFVCHASEDKNGFVKPLADALKHIGLRVWYDEFSLKTGDSLRQAIEKGLSQSQYGIVIVSPRFLKKDWPQKELDGLVAREVNGKKVILPIWHEIDANILLGYSPMLAGRKAISSALPMDQIVKKLLDDMKVKPKRKVGIDTFHGDTWGGLTNLLGGNAFELVRINSKIDDESLRSIKALIIATRGMNSDKGFEESEIDAIQGFVTSGGSILCVDLAWSWVYPKYGNKPLEQFPLNILGKKIGFCITGKNINPPVHFSTEIMEGVETVKREKWDSSEIEFYGQNAQGFIMDDKDRIIAGMMPVGEGLVAVVGHRGLLVENPEIMLRILAYFAREKQWTACG